MHSIACCCNFASFENLKREQTNIYNKLKKDENEKLYKIMAERNAIYAKPDFSEEDGIRSGELEVELIPQGTLATRCMAAAYGMPAVWVRAGVGTEVAIGKETRVFDGVEYLLEMAFKAKFAIVKAWKGDTHGNLIFRKTTRNFNMPMAMAGQITIAEVEELVPAGTLDPDHIHVPGIYVHRIFVGTNYEKRIEQRTVRARS